MILDLGLAVRLVTSIRTHTALRNGCPEWDAEGVRAMLTGTEGSPGAVLAAACLAAEDASLRKPSSTALRNHWPVNAATEPPARRQNLECPEHHEEMPCQTCVTEAGPSGTPEEAEAIAECKRLAAEGKQRYREKQAAIDTARQEAQA